MEEVTMYNSDIPTWAWPVSAVILVVFIVIPIWLTVSQTRVAKKFRVWRDSDDPTIVAEKVPHVHKVDGVVIMHSHAKGDLEHSHATVHISIADYVALVKARNTNT